MKSSTQRREGITNAALGQFSILRQWLDFLAGHIYGDTHRNNRHSPLVPKIVIHLFLSGAQSTKSLGERFRLPKSTLSETLARMERDGLICRSNSNLDNRQVIVDLNPDRLPQMREMYERRRAAFEAAFQGWSEDDLEIFVNGLVALAASAERSMPNRQDSAD